MRTGKPCIAAAMLTLVACANTFAFYDASYETHNVVTNVLDFGATNNGTNDNDSTAFQAAIDYVAAQPGGGDLMVPLGEYVLQNVYPQIRCAYPG